MKTRFKPFVTFAFVSAVLAMTGCDRPAQTPAASSLSATQIDWRQGDVEDAFAEAAEQNKPVLLFWGAVWCPPCNVLKAGLFQDAGFVARTRDFVPVYLDGDSKGAQAWGERFGIRGYPTLIVLRPDRTEITRLSGGDPERVVAALEAARKGGRNVDEVLKLARETPEALSADDWTLLSEFGWGVDNGRLVKPEEVPGVLEHLAASAPTPVLQRRFALLALTETKTLPPERQAQARTVLETVLQSPDEVRANRETLVYDGVKLVALTTPEGAERKRLGGVLIDALDRLSRDPGLGTADRLSTLYADIALFRAGGDGEAPQALRQKVRERVAEADKAAKSAYERQSLISTAAWLLSEVGEKAEAERLLTAELEKSQTPYYYMPALAELAEARGDKAAALDWLRKGYETSEGPATRVQWGVIYVRGLIRLTPEDKAAIEAAAGKVVGELASQPEGYHQRTRQRFETLGETLAEWSRAHGGADTLKRLRAQSEDACAAQSDEAVRKACRSWLA